ncbi:hypothetical protein [Phaeodactylibacter xiamenensis]|jgi:hypothetical protein|uniref:Uncharacterized protein n=1 Tax=Phaeodactylibacter xiamenensis TaxID=1524460 RepID=A0A098S7D4_9BACT|nr:hypothetical protein [Phaeodactylibacter xiamenensis]KGE88005.1 hypothetical protein IX84_11420 [Phaeodactylibacter xiamenensis]MCR9055103.1 hypothetical protein [bacterium]
MGAAKKLTNLQIELLEVFKYDLSETQLKEIRALLADYFAEKVTHDIDQLFEAKGWGAEKIEEWSKEHMRTKYN